GVRAGVLRHQLPALDGERELLRLQHQVRGLLRPALLPAPAGPAVGAGPGVAGRGPRLAGRGGSLPRGAAEAAAGERRPGAGALLLPASPAGGRLRICAALPRRRGDGPHGSARPQRLTVRILVTRLGLIVGVASLAACNGCARVSEPEPPAPRPVAT